MIPGKSKIAELFNGTRVFVIPFYQRSYVWGEQQWERLLTDIIAVGNKTTDYFLGALILKQMNTGAAVYGDYKIVIDGQQRTASKSAKSPINATRITDVSTSGATTPMPGASGERYITVAVRSSGRVAII